MSLYRKLDKPRKGSYVICLDKKICIIIIDVDFFTHAFLRKDNWVFIEKNYKEVEYGG